MTIALHRSASLCLRSGRAILKPRKTPKPIQRTIGRNKRISSEYGDSLSAWRNPSRICRVKNVRPSHQNSPGKSFVWILPSNRHVFRGIRGNIKETKIPGRKFPIFQRRNPLWSKQWNTLFERSTCSDDHNLIVLAKKKYHLFGTTCARRITSFSIRPENCENLAERPPRQDATSSKLTFTR